MNQKRIAGLLLAAMLLAVTALPAGAQPAKTEHTRRIAIAGGPLSHAALSVNGGSASPLANWTAAAAMPVAVAENGGGANLGARVFVPGGYTSFTPTLHDRMQVWNRTTDTWTNEAEVMPVAVGWADAAVCADPASGKVYVVNGVDGAFLYAALQIYDSTMPVGSRWSFGSFPMLSTGEVYASQSSGCAFLGGQLYLFGGYGVVDPDPAQVLNKTWKYDPVTDTWTDTGMLMTAPRLWHAYANNTAGTMAFAGGGTNDLALFTALSSTERFTPAGGWAATTPLPGGGRLAPGMSVVGSNVLIYGGGTGDAGVGFTLQNTTLRCKMNGSCASWTNPNRTLVTARWFFAWAGAGSFASLAGFAAGGSDSAGAFLASAERLP